MRVDFGIGRRPVSRRTFLRGAAAVVGLKFLPGCNNPASTTASKPEEKPFPAGFPKEGTPVKGDRYRRQLDDDMGLSKQLFAKEGAPIALDAKLVEKAEQAIRANGQIMDLATNQLVDQNDAIRLAHNERVSGDKRRPTLTLKFDKNDGRVSAELIGSPPTKLQRNTKGVGGIKLTVEQGTTSKYHVPQSINDKYREFYIDLASKQLYGTTVIRTVSSNEDILLQAPSASNDRNHKLAVEDFMDTFRAKL